MGNPPIRLKLESKEVHLYSKPFPSGKPREIKHLKLLEPKKPELVTSLERNQANVIKNENHHMVLYQTPDEKIVFDVVSRFDAAMRLSKKQPVIQQNSGKWQFIMSLVKGDTLLIPPDPENDRKSNTCSSRAFGTVVRLLPKKSMMPQKIEANLNKKEREPGFSRVLKR